MINTIAFLTSSLVVIMAPGPDLALMTRLVLAGSPRTAAPAAFGMIAAGALQVALGALGLAALLAARPDLFTAVRWAGAAVLLVWAYQALRTALRTAATAAPGPGDRAGDPPRGRWRVFGLGLLCTGSNPKVGIFLMAFLPQFVPSGMDPTVGVVVLACCYLALGLVWLLVWMRLVHRLSRHLNSPSAQRLTNGLTAAVFGVFALRLALGG
ncbi:LysE family translocator [Streptomyces sp. DSM 41972]|uniref:LysE family translocator n=1 Tax=Streptomyces althioticus subsp. attaecolombicae TaxID=3075534 RepID=A0ABU3I079_9ACTN|nr:LysE family translocator [Streptomyces sp. DSM 41972]SCD88835.1 Threonine/homoserine/homoserine lactone efflux protein [Streptomyces sp. di50b]SCE41380.1 Threonine/homoserine/homoserine lactone efflux protein [Streptomyces sp. di188]